MTAKWSLITVTWNCADALKSFWKTPPPTGVEWIVVDNNSDDDSAEAARRLGATKVITLPKNRGFGAANNVGLAAATGDYIAFVNPDVTVGYGDLSRLASVIDETGALVAPQLINSDGSLQANGRGMPTLAHKVHHRTKSVSGVDDSYTIYASAGEVRFVVWLMGAVVAGSASLIRSIDGWNERFFVYYEDSDIGVRAWKAGAAVVLDGSAQWVHGWARETKTFRLKPWLRETASMIKFYSLYPEFLHRRHLISTRHPRAQSLKGTRVSSAARVSPDGETL